MTLRQLHPSTRQEMVLTDELRDKAIAIWDESFPKIGFLQDRHRLAAGTPGLALSVLVFPQSGPDKPLLRFIFTNMGNSQCCDLDYENPDWGRLRTWIRDLRERLDDTIKDMQSWNA
jgi:hypothetical protein